MRNQAILLVAWLFGALAWVFLPSTPESEELLAMSRGHRVNLGQVTAGQQVVRFDVTNVSDQIVHVDKVSGSCTCMDVTFPGSRLLPGEKRECVVTINVQPKASQSTAVFFDVSAPRTQRVAVLIVYRGVQEDLLRVTVDTEIRQLEPDARAQIKLTCLWRSAVVLQRDDQVRWSLQDASGVTLLAQVEEQRGTHHIQATATLALDARFKDCVTAVFQVEAGRPVRASERRRFKIPVISSVRITPDVLLVDRASDLGQLLGEVIVEASPGWTVKSVTATDWLGTELEQGRLRVRTLRNPPFTRGVGTVTVTAVNAKGQCVDRRVQCVVDMEE